MSSCGVTLNAWADQGACLFVACPMDQATALAAPLAGLITSAGGDGGRRVDSTAGTVQAALAAYRLVDEHEGVTVAAAALRRRWRPRRSRR